MKILSTAFANQQPIPDQYTCKGENISPPLQFLDVPNQTKSFVLIVDDPDAPNGDFVHWVVFNIPATTTEVAENTSPTGVEGQTGFGKNEYGGPCPPSGTHRYFFRLYALDSMLQLPEDVDKQALVAAMQNHIIDQSELVGLVSK